MVGAIKPSIQEAQAPKLDRFSNTAAALANLCISVLNLMLPSASKPQKITFIFMKCTKTAATRAAPFGSDMHQIVCRLGLRPDPTGGAYSAPPDPLAGLGGWTPGEGEEGGEGKGGDGVGGIGTPPPGTGREGREWREGWG